VPKKPEDKGDKTMATTTEKPKAEEKPIEKKAEKSVEKPLKVEDLTAEQQEELLRDEPPPADYAKAPVVSVPTVEEPEAKPEEKVVEKPAEAAPEANDPFVKLERELNKPEGQEDLTDFSGREKAYFHQMRKDRRNRQRAEEERDAVLFREAQKKREETKKELEIDPLEALKKKDPTDFLTVSEVTEILEKMQKPKEAAPAVEAPAVDPVQMRYLQYSDKEARDAHEDYDVVMELVPDIISENESHLVEVAKAMKSGENPAEKMYQLIKNDKEFANLFPVGQIRAEARKKAPTAVKVEQTAEKSPDEVAKEAKARQAQEALEKNEGKPKTTGHAGGGEDKPAGELTLEEIGAMSDREFSKLPKGVRARYLKLYG